MVPKNTEGFSKLYILVFIAVFVIGAVGLTYRHYGFWTGNSPYPINKRDVPSASECDRDFQKGITVQADLMKVRGEPTHVRRFGDFVDFQYRTSSSKDVGCSYTFDKNGKLYNILIYYPPVG